MSLQRHGFRVVQRAVLFVAALVLGFAILGGQVYSATTAAACLERAKFELILCAEGPVLWQLAVAAALALGLSFTLGFLAARRGPDPTP